MRTRLIVPILFVLALLVITPTTWGARLMTEDRLDTLAPKIIGHDIPPQFSSLLQNGTVVLKITEQGTVQDAHVNFLNPGVAYTDQLRYTITVEEGKIKSITKGAAIGYSAIVVLSEDAFVRIYESKEPIEQAKQEIIAQKLRYRTYGYMDFQLQIMKHIGPFIAIFSKDVAAVLPFLGGLITN